MPVRLSQVDAAESAVTTATLCPNVAIAVESEVWSSEVRVPEQSRSVKSQTNRSIDDIQGF